ncbi:MAG: T9SS type A sorting domain-containing protein [Bacteroidetes bacterium]|nr:T9SS type A sorting domain-containing protein [Bacteroidota bacterium]
MKKFFSFRCLPLFVFLVVSPVILKAHLPASRLTDTVTFRMNMTYMTMNSQFDMTLDTLYLQSDNFNDSIAVRMERTDTSSVYQTTIVLLAGVIYPYHYYFIHGGSTIQESVDIITRMVRVRDTTMTVSNFFNNYNPATIPLTFNCDLWYQIKAHHFAPAIDYLDIAGNFNNNGAYDILFPISKDSLYSITLFMDTALLQNPLLAFRFRFNGNPNTTELIGEPDRTYPLHDTLGNNPDTFTCWYNNIDPVVPALPFVYNVFIQDSLVAKKTLTGVYTYEDYNLKPEGNSIFHWYHADSTGGPLIPIDTAGGRITNTINFVTDSLHDIGKYLVFEVTPVTRSIGNDSVIGLPVRVYSQSKIVGEGINDAVNNPLARIYPNPVHLRLFIEPLKEIRKSDLVNLAGFIVNSIKGKNSGRIEMDIQNLASGNYFLRIYAKDGTMGIFKIIIRR